MSSITQRTVETGHWAHCTRTGNDNRRCAQHSGHFVTHFASSAATIPSHRYCRPIQFTRFIFFFFFFPTPLSSPVIDLRTSVSEIKLHTYEVTGTEETRPAGNLDICQIFLPSNFKLRPIVYFHFGFDNEISGHFEEETIL